MKIQLSVLVILLSTVFWIAHAFAGFPTAESIASYCTEDPRDMMQEFSLMSCSEYIEGVIDTQILFSSSDPTAKGICFPLGDAPIEAPRETVLKYIQNHPESKSWKGVEAILEAMWEKYPCH